MADDPALSRDVDVHAGFRGDREECGRFSMLTTCGSIALSASRLVHQGELERALADDSASSDPKLDLERVIEAADGAVIVQPVEGPSDMGPCSLGGSLAASLRSGRIAREAHVKVRRSLVAAVMAGALVVATGATPLVAKKPPAVKVRLTEYTIEPSLKFLAKGKIRLVVKNSGTVKHEVVVVRGNDAAALATKPDGSLDESQVAKADKRGELEGIKAKKTKSKVFKFSPGSYLLFCNIVDTEPDGTVISHFARGMYTTIQAG